MTITEKVAYLKGLADGLNLNEDKGEVRVIKEIIGVLDDLALSVADLEDTTALQGEQLDAVDEDLDALEAVVYDDEDDCCCCDDDDEEYDDMMYEVECPSCGESIYLDESIIEDGSIECPNCGENLEFDIDECECDGDSEGGCDCGCED